MTAQSNRIKQIMEYQTPPPPSELPVQPAPEELTPPSEPTGLRRIAPWWHTLVLVAFVLATSLYSGPKINRLKLNLPGLYLTSIAVDLAVLAFLWFGLRFTKTTLRELIGGAWDGINLLIDAGLAAGFWFVSIFILFVGKLALGLADLKSAKVASDAMKKAAGGIMPQSGRDLALFLLLAVTAGIFEEILFRGYLQKQLGALARNSWIGMVLAAIIFGAAHGYQGARFMVLIAIYGMLFGLLAHFRKNLRPGMMAHTFQDAFSGILFFILTKYHLI